MHDLSKKELDNLVELCRLVKEKQVLSIIDHVFNKKKFDLRNFVKIKLASLHIFVGQKFFYKEEMSKTFS